MRRTSGQAPSLACQSFNHRVIIHCDLDCFYCQVEHRRLGVPREIPLAVQQWSGLIAVNYAARKAGVTRGMRVDQAKRCCPELVAVHVETIGDARADRREAASVGLNSPLGAARTAAEALPEAGQGEARATAEPDRLATKVSLERYRAASAEVFAVLQRFTPECEKASIDEAYLDLTRQAEAVLASLAPGEGDRDPGEGSGLEALLGATNVVGARLNSSDALDMRLAAACRTVTRIRAAVLAETGFTISVGVAHNKMLAKLASARNKPDKQTAVPWHSVGAMLIGLPLRSIRGLGGKLGEAVEAAIRGGAEAVGQAGGGGGGGGAGEQLPPRELTAADLQQAGAEALRARFDEKTVQWLMRAGRGEDDSPVLPNLKAKSINACKSFPPEPDLQAVQRWLRILASELALRILQDTATNARRPRTLVLHHRGPLRRDHLQSWLAAAAHQLTGETSRSCPVPPLPRPAASGPPHAGAEEALAAAAVRLFGAGLPEALPCTRLALGVTDFVPVPPAASSAASIASYYSAVSTPAAPAPAHTTATPAPVHTTAASSAASIASYYSAISTPAVPAPAHTSEPCTAGSSSATSAPRLACVGPAPAKAGALDSYFLPLEKSPGGFDDGQGGQGSVRGGGREGGAAPWCSGSGRGARTANDGQCTSKEYLSSGVLGGRASQAPSSEVAGRGVDDHEGTAGDMSSLGGKSHFGGVGGMYTASGVRSRDGGAHSDPRAWKNCEASGDVAPVLGEPARDAGSYVEVAGACPDPGMPRWRATPVREPALGTLDEKPSASADATSVGFYCTECRREIEDMEREQHEDYHLALSLQREEEAAAQRPGVGNSASNPTGRNTHHAHRLPGGASSRGRKRAAGEMRGGGPPNKKDKSSKSLVDIFGWAQP